MNLTPYVTGLEETYMQCLVGIIVNYNNKIIINENRFVFILHRMNNLT